MTLDIYAEEIIDRFKSPHNFGKIDKADAQAMDYNPACGDEVEIFLKVKDGKISDVRFAGRGCAISQAASDILCDCAKTKTVAELKNMRDEDMINLLGVKITGTRLKCALLGLWALRGALKNGNRNI
ncbi:MAG: iron-sulfur cluster assembly scaffold protein [DPANN group archaeon]|nr:iron-sulfur cluster assembly scaffold protein [DPANN group archaeon]